ncbi:MAG: hypothetical protein JST11_11530 [Acidobacteria bacterium]|nr:hypothetical protein [Acidobacteriota bacterium]
MLRVWLCLVAFGAASQAAAANWNPKLAAAYLDERQGKWFDWPVARKTGGPCLSCHTGVPYLVARPLLRRALGENAPTKWETGLLDALRARVDSRDAKALFGQTREPHASESIGVESIFAAVFLRGSAAAMQRLWDLQLRDGQARGAWNWFELELDPWENTDAPFFGAALAALAVKDSPYAAPDRVAALAAYLKSAAPQQPLQNRLALLWTAKSLSGVAKREWIEEAFASQEKDGGWTNASLGPWKTRENAPPSSGSSAYATAFAAFTLIQAGVPVKDAGLARALDWLRSHQNPAQGYWDAVSMNKTYPEGSMQSQFMREAATGYAAAALALAER